jgi:hypothetical protein
MKDFIVNFKTDTGICKYSINIPAQLVGTKIVRRHLAEGGNVDSLNSDCDSEYERVATHYIPVNTVMCNPILNKLFKHCGQIQVDTNFSLNTFCKPIKIYKNQYGFRLDYKKLMKEWRKAGYPLKWKK